MHSTKLLTLATSMVAAILLNDREARAELVVTISHVTVAPGESGYLDVFVSSDGTDSIQSYLLDFVVGGPQHAASPINFVPSTIPAPQLSNGDYIFFGNSLEADDPFGIDFVTDQIGPPTANDLISVSDGTLDGMNRTINSGDGSFLLARLNFIAPPSATQGNEYLVALDAGQFLDVAALLDLVPISQPFTSHVGSITISTTAVPEPSSIALLSISSIVWLGHSRQRARRRSRFATVSSPCTRNLKR